MSRGRHAGRFPRSRSPSVVRVPDSVDPVLGVSGLSCDGDVLGVDPVVVAGAEQGAAVEVGGAVVFGPVVEVVGFGPGWWPISPTCYAPICGGTPIAGVGATTVAVSHGEPLGRGEQPLDPA